MTESTLADMLRQYVAQYGPKAATDVIIAVLDEEALAHQGKPHGTIASINANLLRQVAGRLHAG